MLCKVSHGITLSPIACCIEAILVCLSIANNLSKYTIGVAAS